MAVAVDEVDRWLIAVVLAIAAVGLAVIGAVGIAYSAWRSYRERVWHEKLKRRRNRSWRD